MFIISCVYVELFGGNFIKGVIKVLVNAVLTLLESLTLPITSFISLISCMDM